MCRSMMKQLILVIEDNKTIAMYEKETLLGAGYDVIVAYNLEEAKVLVKEHFKQIVLSIVDINLPEDEAKALDYLLKHNIPSIAMTGSFHPKLREKIVDKNIVDYIVLEDDQQLELLQATINRIIHNENKKVLIVDDSKSSRHALHSLLALQNFTIFEASDGMSALKILKDHPDISIALIDYEMPSMSGAELTRIIRKSFSRTDLSILAISVHSNPIITIEFLKAGANDFITKPYIKEEVLARIAVNIDLIDQNQTLQAEIKNRQNAEKALMASRYDALNANRAKSNFLANMSHEIRTPMNAIIGFVNILHKKEQSEEKRQQLDIIKDSGNSLMEIIDDILDFSKIESGKIKIENIHFDTREPFENTVTLFRQKAKLKNIELNLEIDDQIPQTAYGDITRIKQIFSNLLSNAIKFSYKDSHIDISLRFHPDAKALHCCVKDYGCGISKQNHERIFNAFEQEDTSTTRKFGGSGLGLSISNSLAKMMDAEISLESKLGEGSSFTLTLKLFDDNKPAIDIDDTDTVTDDDEAQLYGHVLLVEDNVSNQLLMTLLLEEFGLSFDIANNGIEAVEAFQMGKYDLILMDENMPNLNGIEATQKIRALEKHSHIERSTPIIAVTANALKEDRQKFLDAGMDDYLSKPIDHTLLREILKKYL